MKIEKFLKFGIVIFCFFIVECHSSHPSRDKSDIDSTQNNGNIESKSVTNCLPSNWDTLNKRFYVKYVGQNRYYSIDVGIGVAKSNLGYKFDCFTPLVLVPKFYSFFEDWLCLERGCGNNCKAFVVLKMDADSVERFAEFDYAYDIDLVRTLCLKINEQNYNQIILLDFSSKKRISKFLTENKDVNNIERARILDNKVVINYVDGSKQQFYFNMSEFK